MTYRNVPFLWLIVVFSLAFQLSTSLNAAGVYEGDRNTFNRFHGQGTYTYGNGKVYSGEWRDGRRDGKGEQTWANGDHYVGDWSGNRTHGKGVKTWKSGDRYEGEWIGGKPSGTGHFTWANSDEYTGGFLKAKREGMGVFKSKKQGVYQGEWKADKRQGKGSLVKSDGSKVTGDWDGGYLVGDAVFVFKNGDQFTGPTLNNAANGEGVCKRSGKLSPCTYKKGRLAVKKVVKKAVKKVKPKPIVKAKPKVKPKVKIKVKPKVVAAKKKESAKAAVKNVSAKSTVAVSAVTKAVVKTVSTVSTPVVPVLVPTPTTGGAPLVLARPVVVAPVVAKPVVKPAPVTVSVPTVENEVEVATRFARKGKHRSGSKPKKAAKAVTVSVAKPAFLTGPLRSDGAVFSFKHDWIMHGYYDTAPTVWGKFDSIKFGDLKIRAEGGDYELTMVIDVYDGPGAYPLKYFKGVISKPGVASYQTTSTLPGRIVIKFDDGKMIGGTFEFVGYRNGSQSSNEKRTIRSGEFWIPIVK